MVVTEQIEALLSLGLSPTRMLVVPRLVALVIMLPLLTVMAVIVSIVGGMWIASVYAHISTESFITSARQALPFSDVLRGLLKSVVFAVIIAYQGLQTRGGAAGVGKSTTGSVVTAIILIFAFNFALSYILYGNT
jgi:phospholipid/cholesterol/gamma-HCH transport system permease protein